MDRHAEFIDPTGKKPLDMGLPQREPVRMPGRKIADIERDPGETSDLGCPPFR
jgi:hypothetical protein